MFAAEYALSPREKMFFAKKQLIEAENQEAALRKARRKSQHRLASLAPSLDSVDSDRSDALTSGQIAQVVAGPSQLTHSILRQTPMSTYVMPASSNIPLPQPSHRTSSPAASSLVSTHSDTDFSPTTSMSRSKSATLSRRSSRVRFSCQESGQSQASLFPSSSSSPAIAASMSRSNSATVTSTSSKQDYRIMRRESSMDSLRQDIMTNRGSLNKRASYASSIASDPFGWAARGSIESRLSTSGDAEADNFRPQSLPYPKPTPAFARLSGTSNSSAESSGSSVAPLRLRQTLDRSSSLDSLATGITGSGSDDLIKKPSLDARLASMSSLSSYAPSYAPRSLSGSSALGSNSPHSSQRSSLSSGLPPRDNTSTAAYISLLPTRSTSESNIMPSINRGEWTDAELGLSPRSGPVPFHTSSRSPEGSRRPSTLSNSATSPSPKSPPAILADSPHLSDRTDNDDTPMRSDSIDFMSVAAGQVKPASSNPTAHKRTESSLSDIMLFPIPPDRALELQAKSADKPTSQHFPLDPVETTLSVEIVRDSETVMFLETSPIEEKVNKVMDSQAISPVDNSTVWLNSPNPQSRFEASDSVRDMPISNLIGVIVPLVDEAREVPPVSTATVEEIEQISRPDSPELREVLRRIPRAKRSRRMSTGTDGETEESDLDLNTPLVNIALRSNILSSSSRLLSTSPLSAPDTPSRRPSSTRSNSSNSVSTLSLRSGVSLTSGMGWSGSESEEEAWIETVRRVSLRKRTPDLSIDVPSSTAATPTPSTKKMNKVIVPHTSLSSLKAISVSMGSESSSRLSQLSSTSMSTIATALDSAPITPTATDMDNLTPRLILIGRSSSSSDISASGSISPTSAPGDFPWGQSSPPTSPVRARIRHRTNSQSAKSNGTSGSGSISSIASSSSSSHESGTFSRPKIRRSKSSMPRPLREVHGWGAPEVLMDDRDWESSMLVSGSSSSGSISTSARSISSLGTGFSTPSTFHLGLDSESDHDHEHEDDGEGEEDGELSETQVAWSSRRLSGSETFGARTPQLGSFPDHNEDSGPEAREQETTPKARCSARAPSPDIWSSLLRPEFQHSDQGQDEIGGKAKAEKSLMDEEMPDELDFTSSSSSASVYQVDRNKSPLRPKKSLLRMPSMRKLPRD